MRHGTKQLALLPWRWPRLSRPKSETARSIAGYGLLATVLALLASFLLLPFGARLVEDWSRRDVELRAQLVFNSIQEPLADMVSAGESERIARLFERITSDTRVLAMALCRTGGPSIATQHMPQGVKCETVARGETASFTSLQFESREMVVASFPIKEGSARDHLVIVHDLTFAARRGVEARNYLSLLFAGVVLLSGAVAAAFVMFLVRQWLQGFKRAVSTAARTGGAQKASTGFTVLDQELRKALRQLEVSRAAFSAETTEWSKETVREVLRTELPDAEVLVVANREPYIHNHGISGIELQTPASGLVSALEPVMRACGGTWIAHGSGSADADTVDAHDRIAVPPDNPEYTLRRIWISEAEQDGYYYGLANEGLWPLCHIAFTRPVFRESDWRAYRTINERFAAAVVTEAKTKNPIVLIQDYHFALLPRMLRELLPEATIITFWHIPWPNSETFGIFPWKEDIIHGLLGSTIVGFHTQFHCNNFLETVDRFVESRIDREHESVVLKGHETFVRPYPISIEWPPLALKRQKDIATCRQAVRDRLGLAPDSAVAAGIERFDYTKGVLDRMQAVDQLMQAHPEWIGRFTLVQAAAPTRSKLPTYKALQDEALRLADEINAKYVHATQPPIKLVVRHHEPAEVFELFRAADVCVVSSLHDGMNLVAKEFIAARDDEMGVLLLSNFAGASRELSEALIINPYDAFAMGEALHQALLMPASEQHERMRLMRSSVSSRNVYRWAGRMLLDASRIRKKQRILEIAALGQPDT